MELAYAQIAAKGFPQPVARIYLFQGSDDVLKQEAVERLSGPLLDPAFSDFDREERDIPVSGGGTEGMTVRHLLASAAGAPMASERRVVVATNVHRLSKEDQEILTAGIAKLGALSCLILVAGAPIFEAGKVKASSTVSTKLVNAVAKSGVVVLCDAPSESALSGRAMTLLKTWGKTIEPAALKIILARAHATAVDRGGGKGAGDINVLQNELEKAISYAGERTQITRADAIAVGTEAAEENIFALLDAVGKRDVHRALAETEEMLRTGERPDAVAPRTFVMLARHLRMLWGAKYLADRRLTAASIRGSLPPDMQEVLSGEVIGMTARSSFLLRGLQEQALGWTYPALQKALARVLASDMSMKGIVLRRADAAVAAMDDHASNLRLLVVELCHMTGEGTESALH